MLSSRKPPLALFWQQCIFFLIQKLYILGIKRFNHFWKWLSFNNSPGRIAPSSRWSDRALIQSTVQVQAKHSDCAAVLIWLVFQQIDNPRKMRQNSWISDIGSWEEIFYRRNRFVIDRIDWPRLLINFTWDISKQQNALFCHVIPKKDIFVADFCK